MITQIDIIHINDVTIGTIWGNEPADSVNQTLTQLIHDGKLSNPQYKNIITDTIYEHIRWLMRKSNNSIGII